MATPDVIAASCIATRLWSDDFSDSSDEDTSDGDFSDGGEDVFSWEVAGISNRWTVLAAEQECGCSCNPRVLGVSCACFEDETTIDTTEHENLLHSTIWF